MTMENNTMIRLRGVGFERDERVILRDVDLDINRGDFIAVTGPNGGGKTTLLRIMLRLVRPSSGDVEYFGDTGLPVKRLPIGYLPQKNAIDSHFPITVRDLVEQGLLAARIDKAERRSRIDEALATLGLEDFAASGLARLSGGQLQRALLARALVSRPGLLVLDEPLSYLDKHYEQRVYDIIEAISDKTTIVLVSHEISTIAAMATRHIIVDRTLHFCHSHSHFVHYDCE